VQIVITICNIPSDCGQNLFICIIICPVSDAGAQIPVTICNVSSDYGQNLHGEYRK
jgi:hypothetical protein